MLQDRGDCDLVVVIETNEEQSKVLTPLTLEILGVTFGGVARQMRFRRLCIRLMYICTLAGEGRLSFLFTCNYCKIFIETLDSRWIN